MNEKTSSASVFVIRRAEAKAHCLRTETKPEGEPHWEHCDCISQGLAVVNELSEDGPPFVALPGHMRRATWRPYRRRRRWCQCIRQLVIVQLHSSSVTDESLFT